MLLNPLSQTVAPRTPSPSSVTYFMEGPLGPKTPSFQTRTHDPQSPTQIDATHCCSLHQRSHSMHFSERCLGAVILFSAILFSFGYICHIVTRNMSNER